MRIRPMLAEDIPALVLQPSQAIGFCGRVRDLEHGRDLVENGEAWTAVADDGRLLGCAGFRHTFPGLQATAWALLAADLGAAYVPMTRYAAARIADSPLRRIEAIVDASLPECPSWAAMVGLKFGHRLECWGPESRPHLLFERIR